VLDEIVGARIPHASNTRWNFRSRTVSTVFEHRETLIEYMNKIEETSKQTTTINQACGISRMLQDPIFLFWLTGFSRIMPHCDILYNQLQKTCMDAVEIQQCIKTFEDSIQKERNNIDSVQNEIPEAATQVKRRRTNEDPYLSKILGAKEICDTIINHCKDRFSFMNHLSAANLFLTKQFSKFQSII
jgi:hypothetical protein